MFRTTLSRAVALIPLLCVGAAVLGSPSEEAIAAGANGLPNVLIFITDDQRLGLGVMPATRRFFKQEGRSFTRAFATTPLCCPSRASIMTGLYAHNHGVLDNVPNEAFLIRDDTLQAKLRPLGYVSAIYGKYLNKWRVHKEPPHFDNYSIMRVGYNDATWNINGNVTQVPGYTTTVLGDEAVDFIESREALSAPWLMYVNPHAPHAPFTPEPEYSDAPVPAWNGNPATRERNRLDKPSYVRRENRFSDGDAVRRDQLRTLMSVDELVSRVMGALERTGQSNETLAFYVSDNGYLWGEHGLVRKGVPYDQATRVSLHARWPGEIAGGTRDGRLVANIDIAPTVLDALGLPTGDLDGRSLLGESRERRRLVLEYWCNVRDCNPWASTRARNYQYVEYYSRRGGVRFREYYDMRKDPWQLRNLLRDGRLRNNPNVRSLHRVLSADRRCASSECP
jgi:arylsulfatase A-like enzyme